MESLQLTGAYVIIIAILVISNFAVFIIFRVLSKDYDAAVICRGLLRSGHGCEPVAIANMNAVKQKHGPSFKAFFNR